MLRLAIEILATACIWLAAFVALGYAYAVANAGHVSHVFFFIALYFGAFGAVGEIAYALIQYFWTRPRWPRWIIVALWAVVGVPVVLIAAELARRQTLSMPGTDFVLFLMSWYGVPCFVVAYLASWPFR